ncbi:MAG: sulfatase-like hydrolase/transferase, partial [Maribacter sp.]|nr:sulfatase-like hydrolase/transferase [Maribacter sp.]
SLEKVVKPYEAGDVDDEGYVDGLTTNLAITKLRELKKREEPFFLGVGFFKPHLPFNAPKKYWDLYDRAEIPLSPNPSIPENINTQSLHGSGEFNQYKLTDEKASLSKAVSDDYAKKLRHAYLAGVSYIDAQVGKVLSELRSLGLDKNTIVVVWGDHGWHLGDQRVWGKHTLFENALKSALIIKTPEKNLNKKSINSIIETVDIYP